MFAPLRPFLVFLGPPGARPGSRATALEVLVVRVAVPFVGVVGGRPVVGQTPRRAVAQVGEPAVRAVSHTALLRPFAGRGPRVA